jgi:hypothetical protein
MDLHEKSEILGIPAACSFGWWLMAGADLFWLVASG